MAERNYYDGCPAYPSCQSYICECKDIHRLAKAFNVTLDANMFQESDRLNIPANDNIFKIQIESLDELIQTIRDKAKEGFKLKDIKGTFQGYWLTMEK